MWTNTKNDENTNSSLKQMYDKLPKYLQRAEAVKERINDAGTGWSTNFYFSLPLNNIMVAGKVAPAEYKAALADHEAT